MRFLYRLQDCHIVESCVYNSHVEFSEREANVVAHHLAKAIIYDI